MRNTLSQLHDMGYRLAIGSSSKNARQILERTELTEYFDAISDGNNIRKSKPDPEVFLKAAEYLFLKPSECFVVEDAEAGLKAAEAGGFTPIGIRVSGKSPYARYSIFRFSALTEIALENQTE